MKHKRDNFLSTYLLLYSFHIFLPYVSFTFFNNIVRLLLSLLGI